MEKITILGSANAVAKKDQQNTHLLIETENRKILVDCGNHTAASLGRAGVDINEITDLILTHFHADHVGSLPLLIMDMWLEKRTAPLNIYGLAITLEKAQKLLELFDWHKWANMYPVNFITANDHSETLLINDEFVKLTAAPVVHLIPTIGIRVEFSSGSKTVYTCDTEPCAAVEALALGADNLLQEAAGPGKGHTSPLQAAEVAARCGVKRLVLIHFESRAGEEQLLAQTRGVFNGRVDLSDDGMVL